MTDGKSGGGRKITSDELGDWVPTTPGGLDAGKSKAEKIPASWHNSNTNGMECFWMGCAGEARNKQQANLLGLRRGLEYVVVGTPQLETS